jgi:hypothetical protein
MENTTTLVAYQEWERRAGPGMRARYADFAPRQPIFDVRPQDIPTTLAGYRVQASGPGRLTVAREGAAIAISGLSAADLASVMSRLDGKTTVLELAEATNPRWPLPAWCQLLQALLGTAVDLPGTFSALSAAIERTEIVRFPVQPAHAVWRNYWENSTAIRRHLPSLYRSLDDSRKFLETLTRLHVLATLGENGQSYYGGYGLIPTVPGGYREIAVQTAIPETLVHSLEHWSALLEAGPIRRNGETTTPTGQTMNFVHAAGTTVVHPATGDALFSLLDEARPALKTAREALLSRRKAEAFCHLAVFHQIFVNAHPFANINNSIAMNIVNGCLREGGWAWIPHLFLDYLAQRLPPGRYIIAFSRMNDLYGLPGPDSAAQGLPLRNSATLYSRYRADRDNAAAPT